MQGPEVGGARPVLAMERASLRKGQEAAGPKLFRALGKHLDFILSERKLLQGVRVGMTSFDFYFEITFVAWTAWWVRGDIGRPGIWLSRLMPECKT